jgi:glycosyltransferase involved in cell wall biosynthesis
MKSLDILLTYWGSFELLKKAVESVLSQNSDNWRLLVFDDCYPSLEAQKYFAKLQDKRIKYYRNKTNLGITANFNYALQHAEADYCTFLGCDDIMLPNYVETALKHIKGVYFYHPSVEVVDKDGKVYLPLGDKVKRMFTPKQSGIYNGEKVVASLCRGNWMYFPSIAWKTELVKRYGFNEKYKIVEDLVLECRILKNGGKVYVDRGEPVFQYRRYSESMSSREKSKKGIRFKEEDKNYQELADEFSDIGWREAARASRCHITSRINPLI